MLTGLDNAQPGDILIYDEQVFDPAKKRLPLVAYVTETNNKRSYRRTDPATGADVFEPVVGPNFVRVMDYNHGKYPDVCGVTDSWGISQVTLPSVLQLNRLAVLTTLVLVEQLSVL